MQEEYREHRRILALPTWQYPQCTARPLERQAQAADRLWSLDKATCGLRTVDWDTFLGEVGTASLKQRGRCLAGGEAGELQQGGS